jgi:cell wall-associated NlpC family hydrolase
MAAVILAPRKTAAHYPRSPAPAPSARAAFRRAARLAWCLPLALAACGGGERVRERPAPAAGHVRSASFEPAASRAAADPAAANAVLMRAIGLVGTPYRYGGNTPESGFDCSGLVTYVFKDMLDLRLPRTSRELAAIQGPRIATDRLIPADLVFFGRKGEVSHVGIYVGEGRFVHAPSSGGTVRLDRLDGPYWRDHYTGAKRVLR